MMIMMILILILMVVVAAVLLLLLDDDHDDHHKVRAYLAQICFQVSGSCNFFQLSTKFMVGTWYIAGG